MKTENDLLNVYLTIKPLIVDGTMSAGQMSDEAQAGCLIKNAGSAERALQVISSMEGPVAIAFHTTWPRVVGLLEEAVKLTTEGIT